MAIVIKLIDVDGNDIPYERISVLPNYFNDEKCDVYTIQLLGELTNVTDTELCLIKELIKDKLEYGVGVDVSRMLLELWDKIDKLIERKRCI